MWIPRHWNISSYCNRKVYYFILRLYLHTHTVHICICGQWACTEWANNYTHYKSRKKLFLGGKFLLWWGEVVFYRKAGGEHIPPSLDEKSQIYGGNYKNSSRKVHHYCTYRLFVREVSITFHKYRITIEASRTKVWCVWRGTCNGSLMSSACDWCLKSRRPQLTLLYTVRGSQSRNSGVSLRWSGNWSPHSSWGGQYADPLAQPEGSGVWPLAQVEGVSSDPLSFFEVCNCGRADVIPRYFAFWFR